MRYASSREGRRAAGRALSATDRHPNESNGDFQLMPLGMAFSVVWGDSQVCSSVVKAATLSPHEMSDASSAQQLSSGPVTAPSDSAMLPTVQEPRPDRPKGIEAGR